MKKIFSFVIIFIALTTNLIAKEHVIEVNIPLKENIDNKQILNECFSYSIKEEIEKILPYKIDEEKLDRILDYLKRNNLIDDFVLFYKEKEIERNSEFLKKHVIVGLNSLQIKKFLKDTGFYYAPLYGWKCFIDLNGLNNKFLNDLQDIISISNCTSINSSDYDVSIEIGCDKKCTLVWGRMNYKDYGWEVTDKSINNLWLRLWDNFIKITPIEKRFTKNILLSINGLGTIFELRQMDKELKSDLVLIVDKMKLAGFKVKPWGIVGEWNIQILPSKIDVLKSSLDRILSSKALQYCIEEVL